MFDPTKSTYQLPIVFATFFIGMAIAIAVTVTIVITDSSHLPLCWTGKCFNDAFILYAVPIQVTVATVALITLWALFHRSEQTKTQIGLLSEQTIFSNHYKHIEDFEKLIENKLNKHDVLRLDETRQLHRKLFPNTLQEGANDTCDRYRISQTVITETETTCEKVLQLARYLCVNVRPDAPPEIRNIGPSDNPQISYFNQLHYLIHDVFLISISIDTLNTLEAIQRDLQNGPCGVQPNIRKALFLIRDIISVDHKQELPDNLRNVIDITYSRFNWPGEDELGY